MKNVQVSITKDDFDGLSASIDTGIGPGIYLVTGILTVASQTASPVTARTLTVNGPYSSQLFDMVGSDSKQEDKLNCFGQIMTILTPTFKIPCSLDAAYDGEVIYVQASISYSEIKTG